MVGELVLRQGLAGVVLFGLEVGGWWTRQDVQGNVDVLSVSDFILFDVRDFLVRNNGGVVQDGVPG